MKMNVMISAEDIQHKVKQLGEQINAHYAKSDNELVLIGLLRGSVIFMADLCRTTQYFCSHFHQYHRLSSDFDNDLF